MRDLGLVLVVVAGGLYGLGVYLLLQRSLIRIVLGFVRFGHAANLTLLVSGGPAAGPPLAGVGLGPSADPLPQAMVLTAIVITFGVTALLVAMAYRSWLLTGQDEVQDDVEDRRIRRGDAEDAEGTEDTAE